MKKITIIYQFGGRPFLEAISREFLRESLGEFKDYEWIELDCTNLNIGAGYNRLAEQVKTPFVMTVLDDFGFFPATLQDQTGNWIKDAITILEDRKDIGVIPLRKENDCVDLGKYGNKEVANGVSFYNYEPFYNRGWTINPCIMRTEVLKQIIPLDENDKTGNVAEQTGWDNWKKLRLKVAKLDVPYKGVCFHLGWNRSCYFGYKDICKKN